MPRTTKPSPIPPLETVEDLTEALAAGRATLAAKLQTRSREQLTKDLKEIGTYGEPTGSATRHALLDKRRMRFLIHEEFARLGIAPAWRGDANVPFIKGGTPIKPEEQRHRSDSQIIDLMWIYRQRPGHKVKMDVLREFAQLFEGPHFNQRMAEQFATSTLTYPTKINGLNIKPLLQAQLMALRHDLVRRNVQAVRDSAHDVRSALQGALEANPHRLRGRDAVAVAQDLTYEWMSLALAEGSLVTEMRIYESMTGAKTTQARLKTARDTIDATLVEVGSKYAAAMWPDPDPDKKPWYRSPELVSGP